MTDFPEEKKKKKKTTGARKAGSSQTKLPFLTNAIDDHEEEEDAEFKEPGPLLQAEFHRVILDEVRSLVAHCESCNLPDFRHLPTF